MADQKSITDETSLALSVIHLAHAELHYLDVGTGPVLFLIHGVPGRPHDFRWLFRYLKQHFRMIAVALPGMGTSPRTTTPDKAFATDLSVLIELLQALQIDSFSVLGHSFGGALAVALANALPTRCQRVILLASVGLRPHTSLRIIPSSTALRRLQNPVGHFFMPLIRFLFLRSIFARRLSHQTVLYCLQLVKNFSFHMHSKLISELQQPVLQIWSQDDRLIDEEIQLELGERLQRVEQLQLLDGGHNPMRRHSQAITQCLLKWLCVDE